ncbi:cysteine--tRNA ligase [Algicella marina]|uniref:Cysteine--tRNA ligase n=1 Tax=Algicella marina TaxID=2683284 RepID=A0A6P1SXB6_9RHOB|nr:cysteine--tRNA ligase [Algicella marina]QHQ35098.1 cysteine--tRNA ligase [Algicella marina]
MTEIQLHNTASRRKEQLRPIVPGRVSMYLCGPTVYDRAHLGNARPVIMFDVLFRLLNHVYGEKSVTYVRNFTDVDDKINATAQARKAAGDPRSLEDLVKERTEETIGWYHADMDALGALRPTHEPRATAHIGDMVAMIEALIAKGAAYAAEGHVLFNVDAYPHYGQLSGRSTDDMIAGARVEVAPYKKNPMDFVLWKPSDSETPGWPSPWGRGRPGWHIECSAMSKALLGETFDIHGGGIDLQFPHHENEIAQSKCLCGEDSFAKIWMHNEMLQVEGRKMSKSLGNFFTVRDLLEKGVPGEVIRFVFLMTHYSKPMDWTEAKAREAASEIENWVRTLSMRLDALEGPFDAVEADVVTALSDDLNTSLALTRLRAQARYIDNSTDYSQLDEAAQNAADRKFIATAQLLGFDLPELARKKREKKPDATLERFELSLAYERRLAMETKDFSKVDALKAGLIAAGVEVRMSKSNIELIEGPDFDQSKLDALQ